jgi:hypothetical protein
MGRRITVTWHALSFLIAAVLYFVFVLPRWWELMGDVPHSLGTALRIVTGVLIGLTALPVVFTLIKTRKPEYGTPALALTLRVWSIVGHVLAGVLIVATAIAEIWLSLDTAGQWVFGSYGAAATIAVLGAAAFYLAFVAELPPPPPKPLKPKAVKADAAEANAAETNAAKPPAVTDVDPEEQIEVDAEVEDEVEDDVEDTDADETPDRDEPAPAGGRLRNRRPSGKSGGDRAATKRRPSGGVAVSDD